MTKPSQCKTIISPLAEPHSQEEDWPHTPGREIALENSSSQIVMLLLDRGPGPEWVCRGPAGSIWVLEFVYERVHKMSPGDYEGTDTS